MLSIMQRSRTAVAILTCSVLLSACDGLVRDFFGIYDGPAPSTAPLSAERVIVRSIERAPGVPTNGTISNIHMDRVRFIEEDRRGSVDRLVLGYPREIQGRVDSLGLQVGDTLTVSTRYEGISLSGPGPSTVPDWGGYKYLEYPIGAHVLTAVARPSR